MQNYFTTLKQQANSRIKESALSILGITNPNLRNYLGKQLEENENFINGPVIEQTFAWEEADTTMAELAEQGMLSKKLVEALDSQANKRYSFKKNWKPFKHQLKAWQYLLSNSPKSCLITSGTGSGKTECFMIPVLEDLLKIQQEKQESLIGVHALFLYPLNALINSQKERLNAWTQHFDGNIRFCLLNGNTPNEITGNKLQAQNSHPQEVMSRQLMRASPAPILVTNGTMLEYMLVRQVDAPIIEQSKGKLRWIILDEAHSYIGSQAAELALQLRRVLQAFEVDAKDIRFVATSATIAGADAEKKLSTYLAQLAGINENQVSVIGGCREVPELPKLEPQALALDQLLAIEPEGEEPESKKITRQPHISLKRYQALCQSRIAIDLRKCLTNKSAKPLLITELQENLAEHQLTEQQIYQWLDICTATKPSEKHQAFLKVRAHFFQRTLQGLWSCINPHCSEKQSTSLANNEHWPFGLVYTKQKQKCNCTAPVLEIAFCNECNAPHLLGMEKNSPNGQKYLSQWSTKITDEFSLVDENELNENENDTDVDDTSFLTKQILNQIVILAAKEYINDKYALQKIGPDGLIGSFENNSYELSHLIDQNEECAECGFAGRSEQGKPLRRALLGAPFFTVNTIPTILEYCPDIEQGDDIEYSPNSLPGRGRRLITFTDSRQGTAKMSILMQQEAERSRLRGLVIKKLKTLVDEKEALNEEQQQLVEKYRKLDNSELEAFIPAIRPSQPSTADALEQLLEARRIGRKKIIPTIISWSELAKTIAQNDDIRHSMLRENKRLSPEVFDDNSGPLKLADMLLAREFARRPKFKNNLETLGLVCTSYPAINNLTERDQPEFWSEKGFTLQDWKDFLKVSIDFYIREGSFTNMDFTWYKWIGMRFAQKTLLSPKSTEQKDHRIMHWPQVNRQNTRQSRLINLLTTAAKIDLSNKADRDIIDGWLLKAWDILTQGTNKILEDISGDKRYCLVLDNIYFSLLEKAYVCPVTNKILDVSFKNLSPYLPTNQKDKNYVCQPIDLPKIWEFTGSDLGYEQNLACIRQQVKQSNEAQELKASNLWTDINDRAVEGGFYYATAEHSAQQSSERLIRYEDDFKKGKKNVLNCSTTMEMGVDIGGITAVVMNNVPPHPANFLQRAGRAGRSSESRALSYTICKSNPHDLLVFNNPTWAFKTTIPAPYVEFSSRKLVQRHVNSLLLSKFLQDKVGELQNDRIFLNLEWFYSGEENSIANRFITWLGSIESKYQLLIKQLVRGTCLDGISSSQLAREAAATIDKLKSTWQYEDTYISQELHSIPKGQEESAYTFKLKNERARLYREYLLRELATKAFLPGYGFPTDVVMLNTANKIDKQRNTKYKEQRQQAKHNNEYEQFLAREDNVSLSRGQPSRNLAIAIREYAPGSNVVLDGRVHRCAGISLNWQKIHQPNAKDVQKFDIAWRCPKCGQTGYELNLSGQKDLHCDNPNCGSLIPIDKRYQKRTIQPTGFVTDYHIEPTNNISQHNYIPFQPAWVSATGTRLPLPLPEMGYMVVDHAGTVFNHSSGLYGTGYAICLSCGRADSMTSTGEYPKYLDPTNPKVSHLPLRLTQDDWDEKGEPISCRGSAKILGNIHIGAHSNTDVFELILRNPISGEYLFDTTEGRIIATSLVVALRSALTRVLGISKNEVVYSIRPTVVDAQNTALALQLFDSVSGGAGFAVSAPYNISESLCKMVEILMCEDHCESFCSKCLLDNDSRHETELLDRQLALSWLGENFVQYLILSEPYRNLLPGATYCPITLKQKLTEFIRQSPVSISFFLSHNLENWDTTLQPIKQQMHLLLSNEIDVCLFIPKAEYSDELRDFLLALERLGAQLHQILDVKNIVMQAHFDNKIITIANMDENARTPGVNWLESNDVTVLSENVPHIQKVPIDTRSWQKTNDESADLVIEINKELNVKTVQFGKEFWDHLLNKSAVLNRCLNKSKVISVHYSDRYLKNPSYLLLFTEILTPLTKYGLQEITVESTFIPNERRSSSISHDWNVQEDFIDAYDKWIRAKTNIKPTIVIAKQLTQLPHRRTLTLHLDSGRKVQIRFDQGMGYWQINCQHGLHRLDFSASISSQLLQLVEVLKYSEVKNSASWSTDITIVLGEN